MSESKKLYRHIADSIAEDITSGKYTVGERLPTERELAVQYGVSRPTLREALIALEILGLIEAKHGFGILVTGNRTGGDSRIANSEIGAFELIEARRMVEGEIAAMAAGLVQPEHIAQLEALLQQMGSSNAETAEKADREFHQVIANITGNGALITTAENLWDWRYESPFARNILARAASLGMKQRIQEHAAILNALRKRSPAAARQAMHDHMDRVIEHLLNATEIVAIESAKQATDLRRKTMAKRVPVVAPDN